MVKLHDRAGDHHRDVGDAAVVGRHVGQPLHPAHEVVPEEAHGATVERQLDRRRRHARRRDDVLDRAERIAGIERLDLTRIGQHGKRVGHPADHRLRADADHRVATQALALFGRLEQKARAIVAKLQKRADGGFAVGDERVDQRHLQVCALHRRDLLTCRRDRKPGAVARGYIQAQRTHARRESSSAATSSMPTPVACHSTVRWYSRSALS